jgi:Xaa-Pro dipeptidase
MQMSFPAPPQPFAASRRKIDPSRADRLGDGTPNDNDRVEIGPTQLAFREWQAAAQPCRHA